ncbi:MAG: hypothetical protein NC116_12045 [Clostridium sp.]|nr:hypothetical protein [Clostridium sp.]
MERLLSLRKLSVAGQRAGAEAEDFTAVLQAKGDIITEEDLELYLDSNATLPTFALKNATEEKERILRVLKQADGNKKNAARLLGIGRTTLYRKMEEYGLLKF